MLEDNRIVISRNLGVIVCIITLALLIAFLVCLYKLPKGPNIARPYTDLDEILATQDSAVVPVIKEDGSVIMFNPDGSKFEPCGSVEGTKIEDSCVVKGRITRVNTLSIFVREGSSCVSVFDGAGNYLYDKHTNRDRTVAYRGKHDCHDNPTPGNPHRP